MFDQTALSLTESDMAELPLGRIALHFDGIYRALQKKFDVFLCPSVMTPDQSLGEQDYENSTNKTHYSFYLFIYFATAKYYRQNFSLTKVVSYVDEGVLGRN